MKKIALGIAAAAILYWWYHDLVPMAYHADDAPQFGESRQRAAHIGAVGLGLLPIVAGAGALGLKRLFKAN